MTDPHVNRHPPLVLLVNHEEWTARSVESVLRPAGYAVVKTFTGRHGVEVAARLSPDLVIVDYRLSDSLGLDTCRAIRKLPTVDRSTPFVIATAGSLSRRERHECLRAGMWDIFTSPFDPVELVGKLETFLGARREVEYARESTHSDPVTGLYNWNGLLLRAVEMVADAQRSGRWMGCVAVGPRSGTTLGSQGPEHRSSHFRRRGPVPTELFSRVTAALSETTRDSDPTGVLGTSDFLVLAPGTDDAGSAVLARRLVETLNERTLPPESGLPELEFSAGYYASRDEKGGSLIAQDLLGRTLEALRMAQTARAGSPAVLPFQLG